MQPYKMPPPGVGLSEDCLELNECERQAHNSTIIHFESWAHDVTNMLNISVSFTYVSYTTDNIFGINLEFRK